MCVIARVYAHSDGKTRFPSTTVALSLCINWQNLSSQKACDIVGVPDIVSTEMEQSQWWFCDFLISFLRYYYQYVIFVIIIIIIIIIFLQIYIFFVAGSQ